MAAASAALAAAPPLPAGPPADAVIHDIATDDKDNHIRFEFGDDQRAPLASFESLPWDADRRHSGSLGGSSQPCDLHESGLPVL
jgi:hypothetical protein